MNAFVLEDMLPREIIEVLREVGLPLPSPTKKNYEFSDLQSVGLVTDYGQLRRLRERPPTDPVDQQDQPPPAPRFPGGLWVGDNRRVWTPLEIGKYILALRRWSEFWPGQAPRRKHSKVAPIAAPTAMPTSTVPPPDPPSAPIVSLTATTKRRRHRRTETVDAGA